MRKILCYNFSFQAIDVWEEATELIVQRETLIGKLEAFEMTASDPNRFFLKGIILVL